MGRFIVLDSNNKITSVRNGASIVDGEIESDVGEIGQIMQLDGSFIDAPMDFESVKQRKIDDLDKAYNNEILGGFYSSVKNGTRLYGLGYDDQINMEALKNNVSLGLITEGTLEYYAKGLPCEAWSNTEFMMLYQQAMTFKTDRIKTCKVKKALAEVATTISELEVITWEAYEPA